MTLQTLPWRGSYEWNILSILKYMFYEMFLTKINLKICFTRIKLHQLEHGDIVIIPMQMFSALQRFVKIFYTISQNGYLRNIYPLPLLQKGILISAAENK